MPVFALRPAWWIVLWGLICTLSLTYALPAFGYSAADYNPLHQHVVTGADSLAARGQILADHAHGSARSHTQPVTHGSIPAVLAVLEPVAAVPGTAAGVDHSRLCPACGATPLLAAIPAPTPAAPSSLWQSLTTTTVFATWLSGPPPMQPPR